MIKAKTNSQTKVITMSIGEPASKSDSAQQSEMSKWVQRMLKSAKQYHKLCPYFDKKTKQCFLSLGGKCDREGKFDTCPVFMKFLENKYNEYVSKGRIPPSDFLDVAL